jgi:hypothetical protein
LAIVGRPGWTVEELIEKLGRHPSLRTRLFWFEDVSDEYLHRIYRSCSEGEGFGLPLIEAAQHKLLILARDLPVFREVADGHASFFNGCRLRRLPRLSPNS